jgi:hypothetical protein
VRDPIILTLYLSTENGDLERFKGSKVLFSMKKRREEGVALILPLSSEAKKKSKFSQGQNQKSVGK